MTLSPWFGRWRQRQIARRALKAAGEPNLVLDLPCGLGRSWALLAEHPNRFILAADPSREVLDRALAARSSLLVERVRGFQTSVLAIQLPENAVDSILCLHSLNRLSSEQRLMALRELRRVTRDTLILSLPVDGNLEAWHWRRQQGGAGDAVPPLRRDVLEDEFRQLGLQVLSHQDFLPGWAMVRTYVLRKDG